MGTQIRRAWLDVSSPSQLYPSTHKFKSVDGVNQHCTKFTKTVVRDVFHLAIASRCVGLL